MSPSPVRVLIGDDHPIMRDALCSLLSAWPRFTVIAMARSFAEVVVMARRHPADVLILDLGNMDGSPLATLQCLQRDCPALKVIIFSSSIALAPDLLRARPATWPRRSSRPR
jgi:DNA-binding NarL/FixJ family response regulator